MRDPVLEPWMLRTDWREDRRPFFVLDLQSWPGDLPFIPLPPVPILAVGSASHPQAHSADILVEPPISLERLTRAILRTPRACAAVVQLLRATETLPVEHALTAESFAFAMLQGGAEHAAWLATRTPAHPSPRGRLHVRRDGAGLELVIDRPWADNAIDSHMRDALHEAFSLAALDETLGAVRLRSRGRAFSLGADLAEFGVTRDPAEAHAIRARTLPALPMARRASLYDIHVQGACVGSGLELAAFAGRLTASPRAWFQLPETRMGILPGFGGCVSIPRRIGRQRAAALMLSGRRIDARTAFSWGLVDALVDEPAPDDGGADKVG